MHAFESLKTKLKCLTLHATPRSPILTSFISSLIIKVQPSKEIVCSDCRKKYKTKGGYERHRATKHNNWTPSSLTPRTLVDIVKCALQTTIKEKAFAAGLRDELTNYQFQELEEGSQEFATIQLLYNDFVKSNNTEKFYSNFYAQIALKSTTYFRGLSRNAATLLSTSIADKMLAHVRQSKVQNSAAVSVSSALSEKEKAGLQYLGGYVIHNLHKKFSRTDTLESQHAMAILKAGKQESNPDSQKLVSSLNRGGLWSITKPVENIFSRTEHFFQISTSMGSTKIDIAGIAHKASSDSQVISNYQSMVSSAHLVPASHTSKNVLDCMVNMFVRVRSFSHAKDLVNAYKMKEKKSKCKALRKEIKRTCEEQTQARQT